MTARANRRSETEKRVDDTNYCWVEVWYDKLRETDPALFSAGDLLVDELEQLAGKPHDRRTIYPPGFDGWALPRAEANAFVARLAVAVAREPWGALVRKISVKPLFAWDQRRIAECARQWAGRAEPDGVEFCDAWIEWCDDRTYRGAGDPPPELLDFDGAWRARAR